jgi:lipopolysaccharide transport system ATP-binding protein
MCLENGKIMANGMASETIDFYLKHQRGQNAKKHEWSEVIGEIGIKLFQFASVIRTGSPLEVEFVIESKINATIECAITFCTIEAQPIFQMYSGHVGKSFKIKPGETIISAKLDKLPLIHGNYEINLWIGTTSTTYDYHKAIFDIEVEEGAIKEGGPISSKNGYPVISNVKWK